MRIRSCSVSLVIDRYCGTHGRARTTGLNFQLASYLPDALAHARDAHPCWGVTSAVRAAADAPPFVSDFKGDAILDPIQPNVRTSTSGMALHIRQALLCYTK